MAISFTRTRTQMATLVLGKLGFGSGETIPSADQEIVFEALDLRLKEMHKHGTFWRKVVSVPFEFSLDANVLSASGTADMLFPIKMTVLDGSIDEPVDIIGYPEYASIEDKTDTGVPTKALWRGSAEWWFWPVPTAATTVNLTYERIADDTSHGAAPDVDQSMLRALANIVTYDVADHFPAEESKMLRWRKDAERAELDIRKLNAQRKALTRVAVDDWTAPPHRTETDYGF